MKIYGGNFRKIHNFHENFRFFSGCGENNNYYTWDVIGVWDPRSQKFFNNFIKNSIAKLENLRKFLNFDENFPKFV